MPLKTNTFWNYLSLVDLCFSRMNAMYFDSRLLPVKENFLSRQIFKVVNIILILSAFDRASTSNFWFILIFAGK